MLFLTKIQHVFSVALCIHSISGFGKLSQPLVKLSSVWTLGIISQLLVHVRTVTNSISVLTLTVVIWVRN